VDYECLLVYEKKFVAVKQEEPPHKPNLDNNNDEALGLAIHQSKLDGHAKWEDLPGSPDVTMGDMANTCTCSYA
jgi:hypothetical protein